MYAPVPRFPKIRDLAGEAFGRTHPVITILHPPLRDFDFTPPPFARREKSPGKPGKRTRSPELASARTRDPVPEFPHLALLRSAPPFRDEEGS